MSSAGRQDQLRQQLFMEQHSGPSSEAVLIGIHGMGGIGKSRLALESYNKAETNFHGQRIFLHVGQCRGKKNLWNKRCQLLQMLSGTRRQPSDDSLPSQQKRLRNALVSRPLLLVLDDLWTRDQLHWLLACEDTADVESAVAEFNPGSMVVLTSRDRKIVTMPRHKHRVIRVGELDDALSKQLLCHAAFDSSSAPSDFTANQMQQALAFCGGLPLALQVLGKQLRLAQHGTHPWQVRLPFVHSQRASFIVSELPECVHMVAWSFVVKTLN